MAKRAIDEFDRELARTAIVEIDATAARRALTEIELLGERDTALTPGIEALRNALRTAVEAADPPAI